jgi:endoribonuclease Dicer
MMWTKEIEEHKGYIPCDDLLIFDDSSIPVDGTTKEQDVDALNEIEDSESDVDADLDRAHGPKTTSEKRRAQNEVMRAFAANISLNVTQEEVNEALSKGANEEQLSIRDILASQEMTVRITNPRDYQTELFQRARTQNTIAVLDTGTGKTHIATLLLRHVLEEELENRAKGCEPKMAFFLVQCVLQTCCTFTDVYRSTQ